MKKSTTLIALTFSSVNLFAQVAIPGGLGGITNNTPSDVIEVSKQTRIINTSGRTLMLERENEDSWMTFHDPGDACYSMGIDHSDGRKFKLNAGCDIVGINHFAMDYNGNIGIGTNAPLKRLHLKNGDFMSSDNSFDNINVRVTGSLIPEIRFTRWTGGGSDQHNAFIGQFFNTSLGGEYSMGLGTGRSLSGDQNVTNMVLTATLAGNVGIGTTHPDQKLTVKGIIHTNEVRVDLNSPIEQGPDYVFEKDYNLLPLSELETYITQNKHLPEVPSAKEMAADGLNLKEMNLLLLKKVEELTLHLIEEHKIINELKEESKMQQKKIDRLEQK